MTPQEEFQLMLDRSGLTAWHSAGYDGRGIKVMNCESLYASHGSGTGTILKRCAPGAEFHHGDFSVNTKGDVLLGATFSVDEVSYDFATYVKEHNINIITCSRLGTVKKGWEDYCKKLQFETGVIIFNSAGNEGAATNETLTFQFPPSVALFVGAVGLSRKRMDYSSVGMELDFMAYSGLIGGTSAASPFLAGMTACIFSKYGKMSPVETKEYLKSISIDLGSPGDDSYYGEGFPVLGSTEKKIVLTIGSIDVMIDGDIKEMELDQPPVIDRVTGRTLVPVRFVAEQLGASVEWDGKLKTITITK